MPKETIRTNTLYNSDCLDAMKEFQDEQVDLIYLDPPFNSNTNYNIIFGKDSNGKSSQLLAFEDTWEWSNDATTRINAISQALNNPARKSIEGLMSILGESGMMAYLSYMAQRLIECKRILKKDGSIYLHCDPSASHYLKVVMDSIFDPGNFQNEIIWRRSSAPRGVKGGMRHYIKNNDTILFYSKSSELHFQLPQREYSQNTLKQYKYDDLDGRGKYRLQMLRNYSEDSIRKFADDNRIFVDSNGGQRLKQYLAEKQGVGVDTLWNDIFNVQYSSNENTGYPTQKPVALLERIIQASSKPGDLVLDPFCGCGTTLIASNNLNRRWAGIDISSYAINTVMRERIKSFGVDCHIKGYPTDLTGAKLLAKNNPFSFEKWAVTQIPGAVPNERQRWDKGIDGKAIIHGKVDGHKKKEILFQVKGGQKLRIESIRAFKEVVRREKAVAGVFIIVDDSIVSKGMQQLFSDEYYNMEGSITAYPRFQFWSVENVFRSKKDKKYLNIPPLSNPSTGKTLKTTFWN